MNNLISFLFICSAFALLLAVLGYLLEWISKPKVYKHSNKRHALRDYETRWGSHG